MDLINNPTNDVLSKELKRRENCLMVLIIFTLYSIVSSIFLYLQYDTIKMLERNNNELQVVNQLLVSENEILIFNNSKK